MATANGDKIVWILGAGFSRFLGAPLLDELLTLNSARRVHAAYRGIAFQEGTDLSDVAALCEAGIKDKQWKNAEELIERLLLSASSDTTLRVLREYCRTSKTIDEFGYRFDGTDEEIDQMREHAQRLLAADVCLFLKDADPELERWSPYKSWADELQTTDTVITFNYDRVVEIAAEHQKKPLLVPTPTEAQEPESDADFMKLIPPEKGPLLLKMHGSVDWLLHGDTIKRAKDSTMKHPEEAALHCDLKQIAMGVPGPAKYQMTRGKAGKPGPLQPIWDKAASEIHWAAAVVMVGYRMPETDAYSKQWLVDQLKSKAKEHHDFYKQGDKTERQFPVHTVLGPDLEHPHAKRLAGLLRQVDHVKHIPWDMGAEDFLGLVSRRTLAARRN